MTKNGIEYDLSVTPWIASIDYKKLNITYCFSSELYLKKFIKIVSRETNVIKGIKINIATLDDLCNYISIEKRGFRIETQEDYKVPKVFNKKEELNILTIFEFQ